MSYTTAVVLAGGFGTRLRSVVREVPKPLAPIGDRPFLAYLFDYLIAQGVTDVVLAVGYKGGLVETGFGESYRTLRLRYSHEEEPLGTGGAIQLALGLVSAGEPVWVLNGDTFFDCSLAALAEQHEASRADVTVALCRVEVADRYGLVELDDDLLITRFREKQAGASGLINAGVYLLEPAALQRFDFPARFSLERDFFEAHLLDLRLVGSEQAGYFVDIGVPADYARAQTYFTGEAN